MAKLLDTLVTLPLRAPLAALDVGATLVNTFTSPATAVRVPSADQLLRDVKRRMRDAPTSAPHHVVIVGAGFGGLQTAQALSKATGDANLRVTLVDRHNYHLFQPLLYQVATAGLAPQDIGHAIRNVVRTNPAVDFRLGTVIDADLDAHRIVFGDGDELAYDTLVLAAGAVSADYGTPGVEEHAFGLKTLPDAVRMRNHLLTTFERIEHEGVSHDDSELTFVIAGGGPTGVELAGAISELAAMVLRRDHPALRDASVRVVLVEPGDALLGPFSPKSQRETAKALRQRGVELRLGTGISAVTPDGVELTDGTELRAGTVIWAAGVKANPLAAALGLAGDAAGRIAVADDLRVTQPGVEDVFVIGDLAAADDGSGGLLPQLSPVAMQQGRHVAASIVNARTGQPAPSPFAYANKGIMATIGRNDAVAELPGGINLHGFPGWAAWLGVHLVFLVGWRNRASTIVNWSWSYVTFDRGSRLILDANEPDLDDLYAERAPSPARSA